MANWYGTSRTNRVRYVDKDALEKALEPFSIAVEFDEEKGTVMFMDEDGMDGHWPSFGEVEGVDEMDDEVEFSWEETVMPHIQEFQVLVVMQSGAEKHCYVSGKAYNKACSEQGAMSYETSAMYPLKKGGSKRKKLTASLLFTYCPFCGKLYREEEKKDGSNG